jgi:hypothetical protein
VAAASHPAGLIDTDILIDAERGHPDAVALVTAQQATLGLADSFRLIFRCPGKTELTPIVFSVPIAVTSSLIWRCGRCLI